MIWVNEAKRYLADFCSEGSHVHIKNTAYKDKYVCLECEVTSTSGKDAMVYIIEFDDWGSLKQFRSYKMN
jgi:hypothetical protein